jgi:hypothetical protein
MSDDIQRAVYSASDKDLLELAGIAGKFPALLQPQFVKVLHERLSVVAPHIAAPLGAAAKANAPSLPEVPTLPDTTPLHQLLAIIANPDAARTLLDQFAAAETAARSAAAEAKEAHAALASERAASTAQVAEDQRQRDEGREAHASAIAKEREQFAKECRGREAELSRLEKAHREAAAQLAAETERVKQQSADLERRMAALKAAAA